MLPRSLRISLSLPWENLKCNGVWNSNLGVLIPMVPFGWSPPLNRKIHPEFSVVSLPLSWGAGSVNVSMSTHEKVAAVTHWVPLTWKKGCWWQLPLHMHPLFKIRCWFFLKALITTCYLSGTFHRSVTLAIQAILPLREEMNWGSWSSYFKDSEKSRGLAEEPWEVILWSEKQLGKFTVHLQMFLDYQHCANLCQDLSHRFFQSLKSK